VRRGRDGRGRGTALTGNGVLNTVRACPNTEALAESGREGAAAGTGGLGRLILVCLAEAAECGKALFDAGMAHASNVQVTRDSVTGAALGSVGSAVRCGFFGVFGTITFWMFGIFSFLGWVEIDTTRDRVSAWNWFDIGRDENLPERACARHIDEPGVDTLGVELMVAGENAQVLALDKVVGTDGTGEVTRISCIVPWYRLGGLRLGLTGCRLAGDVLLRGCRGVLMVRIV
jgi:hypothetical protein